MFLSPTNALLYYICKMLKYTVKTSQHQVNLQMKTVRHIQIRSDI